MLWKKYQRANCKLLLSRLQLLVHNVPKYEYKYIVFVLASFAKKSGLCFSAGNCYFHPFHSNPLLKKQGIQLRQDRNETMKCNVSSRGRAQSSQETLPFPLNLTRFQTFWCFKLLCFFLNLTAIYFMLRYLYIFAGFIYLT